MFSKPGLHDKVFGPGTPKFGTSSDEIENISEHSPAVEPLFGEPLMYHLDRVFGQ